jgi:3-phosphoglycerate kinase
MIHNKQKDVEINKKDVENDDNQQIKKIKSKWKSIILIPIPIIWQREQTTHASA